MTLIHRITILMLFIWTAFSAAYACAEDIKTYGDCDICPSTIHYGPVKAKEIMGPDGIMLIGKLDPSKRVVIKVDLDGVLKDGFGERPDTGYEVEISGVQDMVYIRSLVDHSYIQLVTDGSKDRLSGGSYDRLPEIYLQSAEEDKILPEDDIAAAWKKMEKSHIYDWVFLGRNHRNHPDLLGDKIVSALRRLVKDQ